VSPRLHVVVGLLAFAAAVAGLPGRAGAQTAKLSASQSSRPLTLPRSTLRFDGGPRWPMPHGQLDVWAGDFDTVVALNLGLGAGFTDRFEGGLLALPLRATPDSDVTDPVLYLVYALTGRPASVGVFVSMELPVEGDLVLIGGFPLRVRLGSVGRLDLAALVQLRVDPTFVDLVLPLELAFDVSRRFFLGTELGLVLGEFRRASVPLGIFLGPTFLRGSRVVGDLRLGARVQDVTRDFAGILIYARLELFFDV
jgi:hypothetical protein